MKTANRHICHVLSVLMMVFAACNALQAQNYVGASIAGHIPMTLDKADFTHLKAGYGFEAGFVYEWQKKLFLLRTGVSYTILCPRVAVDNQEIEQEMKDTRDVPFIYRGTLAARTDRITAGQIAIPFYVGATWKDFYVLAGAKIGINIHQQASIQAQLKTAGDYQDLYYEWLENMPNHGFHDNETVRSTHAMPLNLLDLRVGGETGYTFRLPNLWNRQTGALLRVGAFVEYSVLDIRNSSAKQSETPRTQADWSQYLHVQMTHAYASSDAAGKAANLLTCGLRVTVLFQINDETTFNHCMCNP